MARNNVKKSYFILKSFIVNLNYVNCSVLLFLTVLIFSSKKIYKDLIKAERVSSKVVLFIVEGISSFLIIIIEINP